MYSELDGIDYVVYYNKDKQKWTILNIMDRTQLDDNGWPWYLGAYGNCLIYLKEQKITDRLYMLKKSSVSGRMQETVLNEHFLNRNAEYCVTRESVLKIVHESKRKLRMRKSTIQKYLQYVTKIEKFSEFRSVYHVGANFAVDVVICEHNKNNKNDLMNLWVKNGHISQFLPTHIVITTYYTDKDGNLLSRYNITHKRKPNGRCKLLDFNYVWEATPENIEELVAECIRLYLRNNKS